MSWNDGIWITRALLRPEGVDRLDERLDVLRRRRGLDAVAEVEDVTGLVAHRLEQAAGAGDERGLWAEEQRRVEVALQRHRGGELAAPLLDRQAPVERDHVVADLPERSEVRRHAGREEDGGHPRLPERLRDARQVGEAELLQVLAPQLAEPALEDLDRLGPGRDLRLELHDGRPGE